MKILDIEQTERCDWSRSQLLISKEAWNRCSLLYWNHPKRNIWKQATLTKLASTVHYTRPCIICVQEIGCLLDEKSGWLKTKNEKHGARNKLVCKLGFTMHLERGQRCQLKSLKSRKLTTADKKPKWCFEICREMQSESSLPGRFCPTDVQHASQYREYYSPRLGPPREMTNRLDANYVGTTYRWLSPSFPGVYAFSGISFGERC